MLHNHSISVQRHLSFPDIPYNSAPPPCISLLIHCSTFFPSEIDHTQHGQSKLNCEVLLDDLAFEVRWAVAGESIVIQLVAKLGEY